MKDITKINKSNYSLEDIHRQIEEQTMRRHGVVTIGLVVKIFFQTGWKFKYFVFYRYFF